MRALLKNKDSRAWAERVICIICGSVLVGVMSWHAPDQVNNLIQLAGALLVFRGVK